MLSVLIIGASLIGSQVARVLVGTCARYCSIGFSASALNDVINLDQVDLVRAVFAATRFD